MQRGECREERGAEQRAESAEQRGECREESAEQSSREERVQSRVVESAE